MREIVSTWHSPSKGLYLRFYENGTLHQASSLDSLDAKPYATSEIWFEGTQMYLKEKAVSGVPSCGDEPAIYEVRLYPDGTIQIVKIKDKCSPRAGDTALKLAPVPPTATPTPVPISHVYAFGDSDSDNGNYKQLAPSWLWDVYWEGRLSNGPVAVEVLANRLNVELTDYAVAGAKSDTSNVDPLFPNTGALGQVKKFKTELNGHSADPNALYFVMIGTNDYLEVLNVVPSDNPTLADHTVDNIATLITQLAQLGAKRFLVVNSADIAVTPYVITNGRSDQAAEFQALMNSRLSSRLDELKSQLKIEITLFDYVTLSTKIRENPSDYGLSNLTDACQPVFFGVKSACASPDQYYFWDEAHLTRRVHQIFGEAWAALFGK